MIIYLYERTELTDSFLSLFVVAQPRRKNRSAMAVIKNERK